MKAPKGTQIRVNCKVPAAPTSARPPRSVPPHSLPATDLSPEGDDRDPGHGAETRSASTRASAPAGQGAAPHRPLPDAREDQAGEMPDRVTARIPAQARGHAVSAASAATTGEAAGAEAGPDRCGVVPRRRCRDRGPGPRWRARRRAGAPGRAARAPIAAHGLRVQPPTGWARGSAAMLTASASRCGCATPAPVCDAAVELLPAASPTLLPAGLRPPGAPESWCDLGTGRQAWRYRAERSDGVSGGSSTGRPPPRASPPSPASTCPGARPSGPAVPCGRGRRCPDRAGSRPGSARPFSVDCPRQWPRLDAARTQGARALDAADAPRTGARGR